MIQMPPSFLRYFSLLSGLLMIGVFFQNATSQSQSIEFSWAGDGNAIGYSLDLQTDQETLTPCLGHRTLGNTRSNVLFNGVCDTGAVILKDVRKARLCAALLSSTPLSWRCSEWEAVKEGQKNLSLVNPVLEWDWQGFQEFNLYSIDLRKTNGEVLAPCLDGGILGKREKVFFDGTCRNEFVKRSNIAEARICGRKAEDSNWQCGPWVHVPSLFHHHLPLGIQISWNGLEDHDTYQVKLSSDDTSCTLVEIKDRSVLFEGVCSDGSTLSPWAVRKVQVCTQDQTNCSFVTPTGRRSSVFAALNDPKRNELLKKGADPTLITFRDQGKTQFATVSLTQKGFVLGIADNLDEMNQIKKTVIAERVDLEYCDIWAPELAVIDGVYYVYFAGSQIPDGYSDCDAAPPRQRRETFRMYAMHSASLLVPRFSKPQRVDLPGPKSYKGLGPIDGVPIPFQGKLYFAWSANQTHGSGSKCWVGENGKSVCAETTQNIFFTEMKDPYHARGNAIVLSEPDSLWQFRHGAVNEGPQPILDPGGQLHLIYSANGSWTSDYCLADLRLRHQGNPLNPADWEKSPGCLFGWNAESLVRGVQPVKFQRGVGHHSFGLMDGALQSKSQGGVTYDFLYHGVFAPQTVPVGQTFWSMRNWYHGTFQWKDDVNYGSPTQPVMGWSLEFHESR